MDGDRYSIRAFVDADYDAIARLDDLNDPGRAPSAQDYRHWREAEMAEAGHDSVLLIAVDRPTGTSVAYGELAHTSFNYHPNKYRIHVGVDPAAQRQGIGTELYARLERMALERKALRLWGGVRSDDAHSVHFYERRGFRTLRRTWLSRLDVAEANLASVPDRAKALSDQGIRISTLAEEGTQDPEVRRRVYELARAASADVPRLGDYTPVSFEQFVQIEMENPGSLPEGFFLASHDGKFVGMTILERELPRPNTLHVGFTGTLRSYRGRGIASQLKRAAVGFARDQGFQYLVTHNDSLNEPIWAINEKLGFRRLSTELFGEKDLTASGAPL